jgi:hypothetical protein
LINCSFNHYYAAGVKVGKEKPLLKSKILVNSLHITRYKPYPMPVARSLNLIFTTNFGK